MKLKSVDQTGGNAAKWRQTNAKRNARIPLTSRSSNMRTNRANFGPQSIKIKAGRPLSAFIPIFFKTLKIDWYILILMPMYLPQLQTNFGLLSIMPNLYMYIFFHRDIRRTQKHCLSFPSDKQLGTPQ